MSLLTEEQRKQARERSRAWRTDPANREREKATKRTARESDPERWRVMKAASSARYAEKNRAAIRAQASAVRERLRLAALAAYGDRCNCSGCHVHHVELLTIDHLDGSAHHRQNRRSTRDFYRWLEKNGYPNGFQVLCGSCNLAKADRNACPLLGQEH